MAIKYAIRSNHTHWGGMATASVPNGMYINNDGNLTGAKSSVKVFDSIDDIHKYMIDWKQNTSFIYGSIRVWAVEIETKEILKSYRQEIVEL
jgi:hypothetical protein